MGIPLTCNGTIFNNSKSTLTLDSATSDGDWIQDPAKQLGPGESTKFKVEKTLNLDFSITYRDDQNTSITCSGSMHKGAQAGKFKGAVSPEGRYDCVADPSKTRDNPAVVSWTITGG